MTDLETDTAGLPANVQPRSKKHQDMASMLTSGSPGSLSVLTRDFKGYSTKTYIQNDRQYEHDHVTGKQHLDPPAAALPNDTCALLQLIQPTASMQVNRTTGSLPTHSLCASKHALNLCCGARQRCGVILSALKQAWQSHTQLVGDCRALHLQLQGAQ
jgi:hypothetical protein